MMRYIFIFCYVFVATISTTSYALEKPNENRDMMRELGYGGLKGKKLQKAIVAAEVHDLGSAKNPVRENMPQGEIAYLKRLRCADGKEPAFDRTGSVGDSPYGYIMDQYAVKCQGQQSVDIYMDMYHDGGENRAPPSFTIVN